MNDLLRETRLALRTWGRSPGLTTTALLTLAIGVGATTAIFSVVHAVLLAPLPYPEPDRLFVVWGYHPDVGTEAASFPDFVDWRRENRSFVDLAAASPRSVNLTGDGEPRRLVGASASAGFFALLGVRPQLGRVFDPGEETPGRETVTILSDALWRERFGADPGVVGRTLQLDGVAHTVIGVAPPGFRSPSDADLWTPLALDVAKAHRRSDFLLVTGRLRPGVDREAAQAEMTAIAARLEAAYPDTNAKWSVRLVPLHEQLTGDVRPALLVLLAAVGLVLLVSCANVANLLLARAAARRRERAIRAALGASRARRLRESLVEGLVLGALGAAAGLAVAALAVRALVALAPGEVPRLTEAAIHPPVLLFAATVAILSGLLFGLAPALGSERGLHDALRERGGGGRRAWGRQALVVAEVALSLMLAIGAGLAVKSFGKVLAIDPGFRAERLLTLRLALPASRYGEPPAVASFYARLLERVKTLPGVTAAALVNALPTSGGGPWWSISLDDRPDPTDGSGVDANVRVVDPGYFQTMGIPLERGRAFADSDRAGAPLVALVNEAMARRFWPGGEPIGRRVAFDQDADGAPRWREIVGVVGDVRHEGLDQDEVRGLYVPHAQRPFAGMTLVVRAAGEPLDLVAPVRGAVRAIDPEQPVYAVETMDARLSASLAERRFSMLLLSAFAGVALVLAAVGIYGVVAYGVTRQRREIGLRMALGARRADVLGRVLAEGARLAALGAVAGLAGAFLLTRGMRALLFGVSATDPALFALLPLGLVAVAVVASLVPARRATRVDPMSVLRED